MAELTLDTLQQRKRVSATCLSREFVNRRCTADRNIYILASLGICNWTWNHQ